MKTNRTLRGRLLACFGALVLVAALGVAAIPWIAARLSGELDGVADGPARKIDKLGELNLAFDAARISSRNMLVYGFIHQPEISKSEAAKFAAAVGDCQRIFAELRPLMIAGAEMQEFENLATSLGAYASASGKVNEMSLAGDPASAARESQEKLRPLAQASDKAKTALYDTQRRAMRLAGEKMKSYRSWSLGIAAAGAGLLLLAAGFVFAAIQRMSGHLRDAIRELSSGAREMASASGQLSASSQAVAGIASQQAASLQETASAVEEISAISKQNADSATAAASVVAEVDLGAHEGDTAIQALTVSMDGIGEASQRISKILRVIDEIAFQTNILALNAAVEAARAGDAGSGFAVVADEVRSLAHRSAQAAKDTAELVENSLASSGSGRASVEQVTAVFHAIGGNTGKLRILVDDVSARSKEQSAGMTQLAGAVSRIEEALQSTAASAQESASAIAEMSAQASGVERVAVRLKQMVGSG